MSFAKLPFDVLGQVGPILAWAEGDAHNRLPESWSTLARPLRERERGWLLKELPAYSYDNVDDIVRGSRWRHRVVTRKPARLPSLPEHRRPSLDPPRQYDLIETFRRLTRHFLVWNGTETCIREGRMIELHELGIRLPAGHIVRHAHARAISEGAMSFDEALELPELMTLLPSNSFGLRSVVRAGLAESHLHLKGVISAEETWANNLLGPVDSRSIRSKDPEERRLLILNLFAGRLLALAVWMSLMKPTMENGRPDSRFSIRPLALMRLLDRVYFASSLRQEQVAVQALQGAIAQAVYGRMSRNTGASSDLRSAEDIERATQERLQTTLLSQSVPKDYRFLLRWISPTASRVRAIFGDQQLPGNEPEGLEERTRAVHRLHLAAHLRLVQLTPRPNAVRTLDHPDPRRYFLHQALFRYLVCRTHHWQRATQQGRTTGLRYFRKYYGSSHRQLDETDQIEYSRIVMRRLRHWRGLRVLEGRVSPPQTSHELVPWILAHARPKERRIEKFGLVVHFKKEDEDREERTFSSGKGPTARLRWGTRRRLVKGEAQRLYRVLREPTPVVPFIVGIDACNLEISTPPEVFAPAFRYLREMPITFRGGYRRFSPYFRLDPAIRRLVEKRRLGMTFHVGEDFRHLLSGLRAICEVVDFLKPSPGDRLGHGTALALDPKDWLEGNGYQAVLPKIEWLDTLVWVHHFLGPGDNLVGELSIEDRIQRLSWQIYSKAIHDSYDPLRLERYSEKGEPIYNPDGPPNRGLLEWNWSPLTLWDSWRLRQLDPYSLDLSCLFRGELKLRSGDVFTEEEQRWRAVQERVIKEVAHQVGSKNAMLLLGLYWLSPEARANGDEVIVVNMQSKREKWLELCSRVEEKMKRLIHEKELVVEVNPSSNRIIGPMAGYHQHHVFRLTLDKDNHLKREVRVSVNTDNPAVCNTTLAHEHYILGETLIDRGVPEAEVVKWLHWLRENGQEYNFVRRTSTAEESPDMKELLGWLQEIRPGVLEARTRQEKLAAFWQWKRDRDLQSPKSRSRTHGGRAGQLFSSE